MAQAAGPDGDDASVRGCAFVQPVAGAVEERCSCEEAVAVAGSGGDLAFDRGDDGEGFICVANNY